VCAYWQYPDGYLEAQAAKKRSGRRKRPSLRRRGRGEGSEEEGGKHRRSKSGKKRKIGSELQTAHGHLRFPLLYQNIRKYWDIPIF